jgi:hypothetical protein
VGGVVDTHSWYDIAKDFSGTGVAFVGVIVTGTIAGFGLRSFEKFKREQIEERRIDVAIDALTIAYEARFVFDVIRSRIVQDHEWADAKEESGLTGSLVPVSLRKGQRGAYAVLKRIDNNEAFFKKVERLEPKFMAVFGAKTEEVFTLIYNSRSRISGSAEILFDLERVESDRDDEHIRNELVELRRTVFGSKDKADEDKTAKALNDFREQIEAICRPIVDHQYGKRKSP